MAKIKYFSGDKELTGIRQFGGKLFGFGSVDELSFVEGKGWQGFTAVERKVEYKSNPSKHVCDSRCINATGRIMKCECSCGGKNHGKGGFMAVAA